MEYVVIDSEILNKKPQKTQKKQNSQKISYFRQRIKPPAELDLTLIKRSSSTEEIFFHKDKNVLNAPLSKRRKLWKLNALKLFHMRPDTV